MKLWVGTSGYSYKEWKGSFYPEKLAPAKMLGVYASRLPAVEINNTFYRLPKASVLEGWAEQVPTDFRFAIKASRRISHFKRLKDAGDETGYLLKTLESLGERLGVVLVQLPPFQAADLDRLATFLDLIPAHQPRVVFEFRHPSWFEQPIVDLLTERGCALCFSDTEGDDDQQLVSTTDWGYIRLRRDAYEEDQLAAWYERIQGQGWSECFVFFKHEDGAVGPAMAESFLGLADER